MATAKGGQWRLVIHGLGQLGPLADEVTYGTAMHAAVLGKAWRQSVALFEEMCLGPTDRDTSHTIPHPCKKLERPRDDWRDAYYRTSFL